MAGIRDITTSLLHVVDDLIDFATKASRKNITDICDIEVANNDIVWDDVTRKIELYHSFVSKSGSLGTIIEVKGISHSLPALAVYQRVLSNVHASLRPWFKKKGYQIQVYFSSDPENVEEEIKKSLKAGIQGTQNLKIDISDIMLAQGKALSSKIVNERVFIVLWSTPELLSRDEKSRKGVGDAQISRLIKLSTRDSINLNKAYAALFSKHQNFCSQVISILQSCGIGLYLLNIREAYKEIRRSTDKEMSETWQPLVIGDIVAPTSRRKQVAGIRFDGQYPPTAEQFFTRSIKEETSTVIRVGEYFYSTFFVKMSPIVTMTDGFNQLCENINRDKKFPWRVSFFIDKANMSWFSFVKLLSHGMSRLPNGSDNFFISEGLKFLLEVEDQDVSPVVNLRMAFTTWCKIGYDQNNNQDLVRSMDKINEQRMILESKVNAWKEPQLDGQVGDPVDAYLTTCLGVKQGSIAPKLPMPLLKAVEMLPFARTRSPWKEGGTIFHTEDGKLIPFEQLSQEQDSSNGIVFAPPGGGKSFLLNYLNMGLLKDVNNPQFPMICNIDSGESSFGIASLTQDSLPDDLKHQVTMIRLDNKEEFANNIFDTQLGCRFPLQEELEFQVGLFKIATSNSEQAEIPKPMEALIRLLIREAYVFYSDMYSPKVYSEGLNNEIDKRVIELDLKAKYKNKLTYWQIVDEFAIAGFIKEAQIAQTYAVPILSDLSTVLTKSSAIEEYKIIKDSGNEHLVTELGRTINELARDFPVLAKRTRTNYFNARLKSIDLDSCRTMSAKNKSVMYVVAINIGLKGYFLSPTDVQYMPYPPNFSNPSLTIPVEFYREYHSKRAENLKTIKKVVNIDEFHLISRIKYFMEYIIYLLKIGRKFNIGVTLISQNLEDFNEGICKEINNVYILSGLRGKDEQIVRSFFEFNSDDIEMAKNLGAQANGNRVFLARYKLKRGWVSFRLCITVSKEELWTYESSPLNSAVRSKLYDQIGSKKARKILATLYPETLSSSERFNLGTDEFRQNYVQNIVNEIIKRAEEKQLM